MRRVRELRKKLGNSEEAARYGVLVDRYLPAIQTIAYLSLTSPEAIGHTYVLSRELSSLQESALDPLDVIASPEEIGQALANIVEQAAALQMAFEVVRQAIEVSDTGETTELAAVRDVLDTLVPGLSLLRHVTAGTRSLVTMAEAIETAGFLTEEFGQIAGAALDQAQQELTLAREEVTSLQELLSLQGIDAESFLPSVGFGSDNDSTVSISTTERLEVQLDEAISATKFLRSFLGFEEPRTYLLLAQNQQEIRASGGFIGVAVEVTVDKGELSEPVYQNSVTVDREPYTDNPTPPEGLFWYLWMGRLLFRDANWHPHFPSTAARVAEIYRMGQDIQVDGVITTSKLLAWDLVELFGDIKVPEVEEVLTRQTTVAYTEGELPYVCLARHDTDNTKRCFDEDLFFALNDKLTATAIPSPLRRRLVDLVKKYLDRKNILVHVFPPIDDSFLWERGWNGAVPLVDHDYLMIVDSSLPGHSNASVQRSWEYRVSLSSNQPVEAQLRLRYDNLEEPKDEICNQFAWLAYHCYWNYFRVYISPLADRIQLPPVPLHEGSAKLIWGYPDADSASVVPNSDTRRLTELGGFIAVEPGSATTVPIQYHLKPGILRPTAPGVYEYRLLVQKQPGVD